MPRQPLQELTWHLPRSEGRGASEPTNSVPEESEELDSGRPLDNMDESCLMHETTDTTADTDRLAMISSRKELRIMMRDLTTAS